MVGLFFFFKPTWEGGVVLKPMEYPLRARRHPFFERLDATISGDFIVLIFLRGRKDVGRE